MGELEIRKSFHKDNGKLERAVSAEYGVRTTEKFQALFISFQSGMV